MAEQKTKLYGSVKRFGVRYGTKLKHKLGKIEAERRLSTKCPHCGYDKVRRIAAGIWHCTKCESRFTGKAYTLGGPAVIKEAVTAAEAPAEEAAAISEEAEYEEEETKPEDMKSEEEDTHG